MKIFLRIFFTFFKVALGILIIYFLLTKSELSLIVALFSIPIFLFDYKFNRNGLIAIILFVVAAAANAVFREFFHREIPEIISISAVLGLFISAYQGRKFR